MEPVRGFLANLPGMGSNAWHALTHPLETVDAFVGQAARLVDVAIEVLEGQDPVPQICHRLESFLGQGVLGVIGQREGSPLSASIHEVAINGELFDLSNSDRVRQAETLLSNGEPKVVAIVSILLNGVLNRVNRPQIHVGPAPAVSLPMLRGEDEVLPVAPQAAPQAPFPYSPVVLPYETNRPGSPIAPIEAPAAGSLSPVSVEGSSNASSSSPSPVPRIRRPSPLSEPPLDLRSGEGEEKSPDTPRPGTTFTAASAGHPEVGKPWRILDASSAAQVFGIQGDQIQSWMKSVGESATVTEIRGDATPNEEHYSEIVTRLLEASSLGHRLSTGSPDKRLCVEGLVSAIVNHLSTIKPYLRKEPMYLSAVGNEIRITTTVLGRGYTGRLLAIQGYNDLESPGLVRNTFMQALPDIYRASNESVFKETGWYNFAEGYRVHIISVEPNDEFLEGSPVAPRQGEIRRTLYCPKTAQAWHIPDGYTVRVPADKGHEVRRAAKPVVENMGDRAGEGSSLASPKPSLRERVVSLSKGDEGAAKVGKSQTTFGSAFATVYDLRKWDKGLFLVRLAAWVTTVALGFIPLLGLWAVSSLIDCLGKRKSAKDLTRQVGTLSPSSLNQKLPRV